MYISQGAVTSAWGDQRVVRAILRSSQMFGFRVFGCFWVYRTDSWGKLETARTRERDTLRLEREHMPSMPAAQSDDNVQADAANF